MSTGTDKHACWKRCAEHLLSLYGFVTCALLVYGLLGVALTEWSEHSPLKIAALFALAGGLCVAAWREI